MRSGPGLAARATGSALAAARAARAPAARASGEPVLGLLLLLARAARVGHFAPTHAALLSLTGVCGLVSQLTLPAGAPRGSRAALAALTVLTASVVLALPR